METNILPIAADPVTADQKVEKIHDLIVDARTWLAMHNIDNAQDRLATADTLALGLKHGPTLENPIVGTKAVGVYHSDYEIGEWVEVVLGNGLAPIKECCITAVKFSQGCRVHFDLVYVTHTDGDGTKNYQKLYHVPTGLVNAIGGGIEKIEKDS
jgi:hypothetical protein